MTDRNEVAQSIAQRHYDLEPGIRGIFTIQERPELENLPTTPIKLLEVNENTIPAGILPLGFSPEPSIGRPYPSIIVEVTPDEFERIKSDELKLPEGWTLGSLLPRLVPVAEALP